MTHATALNYAKVAQPNKTIGVIKSMFYLKYKHKKIIIQDPIYTTCPQCGAEHQIGLSDILESGGDLYGTQVFCHRCSQERAKQYRGQPWAEQLIREGV